MKLLYCYVGFMDRDGNPSSLRGMKELELNFSTTHVYSFEKKTDSQSDILHCSPRKTPLPEHFWANGDLETNVYNINVIAGMNGSGKSTAIHYLMDLLNYIYHGFGQKLSERDRNIRHDPSSNRNLLLFDTENRLCILDVRQREINNRLRLDGFQVSPLIMSLSEAVTLLHGMKVINLSNTLTQRDYQLHNQNDERLRNYFIYDCTLGAAIGSDVGGFFPYEVYKQVAYLFDARQARARKALQEQIPELRLPRALRLRPLEKQFEKTIQAISGMYDDEINERPWLYEPLPIRLAMLCIVSFVENMNTLTDTQVISYPRLLTIPRQTNRADSRTILSEYTYAIDRAERWIRTVLFEKIVSGSYYLRGWDAAMDQWLGHIGYVNCVAVLPDGRVVSGSSDSTLRVWDAATGQCLQTLEGPIGYVNCVAVLPDGRVVSSAVDFFGSADRTLRVWDMATGQCLQTLDGHSDMVNCVAVLPDGRVVSGSSDSTLRVWDAATGQCLQTLKGHSNHVTCVTVLSDGRVVSGSSDSTLRVWDAATGQCLQTLEGHSSFVTCVAVLPDGRVVSGSSDSTLRVWDAATGRCLQTLEGHSSFVTCVAVLPDGRVVSGSPDRTLRVWDAATGQCLQNLEGHSNWVTCVAVLPDGRVVSGSDDRTLRVWDAATGQCLQTLEVNSNRVSYVAVLPNRRTMDDAADKRIRDRAAQCRKYIDYVLRDPDGLLSQFTQSDTDSDVFKLTIPYDRSNASEHLERSLITFLDLYHKICTPSYTLDFDWGLSSGEENLLRLFSWLFHIFPRTAENGEYRYAIRNNPEDTYDGGTPCDSVLLFMDEADLTFHPEWQRRLIHILTVFLPTIYPPDCVKDLQLVLTTHSPLLLGDMPRENIRFLFREDGESSRRVENQSETFGQNIHTILKNSFFLENGTVGQFASNKINTLAETLDEMYNSGDVSNLSAAELERIRQFIALVAPGVLRTRLEQMLQKVEELTDLPDMESLVRQTKRLSREERRRLLRQLQEDGEL